MALAYDKVFWDTVLTGLEALMETELGPGVKIYLSGEHERRGTATVRLAPLETAWLARESAGETRTYRVELTYAARVKPDRKGLEHLLDVQARINRLVTNNSDYRPGGTYSWHDARLENTRIYPSRQASEPEQMGLVRSSFVCTVTEPIS